MHSREVPRLPREGVVSRLREYFATADRHGGWAGLVHVDVHELYTSESKVSLFPDLPTIQFLIRGGRLCPSYHVKDVICQCCFS